MISCLVIYTAWSGYRIVILLIIIIKLSCILLVITYIYIIIDNDTIQWQRKVIIFGGLNFKVKKLIYSMLFVSNR